MTTKKIWANGRFVDRGAATIPISTGALHYGTCAFEGVLCVDSGNGRSSIFRLGDHIERLFESASSVRIDVPYSKSEVAKAVVDTVKANKLKSCYIRPIVFKSADYTELDKKSPVRCFIDFKKINKWLFFLKMRRGVKVDFAADLKVLQNDDMSGAKVSGRYLKNAVAYAMAKESGYDDAIMLSTRGDVLESSSSNVFIVRGRKMSTPANRSMLEGVTRNTVMELARDLGYAVKEGAIAKKELLSADEVFLTSTAKGIMSVSRVHNKSVRSTKVAEALRKAYIDALSDPSVEHSDWRTVVNV